MIIFQSQDAEVLPIKLEKDFFFIHKFSSCFKEPVLVDGFINLKIDIEMKDKKYRKYECNLLS